MLNLGYTLQSPGEILKVLLSWHYSQRFEVNSSGVWSGHEDFLKLSRLS